MDSAGRDLCLLVAAVAVGAAVLRAGILNKNNALMEVGPR